MSKASVPLVLCSRRFSSVSGCFSIVFISLRFFSIWNVSIIISLYRRRWKSRVYSERFGSRALTIFKSAFAVILDCP